MNDKEKTLIFDYGATLDTNGIHWYHIFAKEHLKYNAFLTDGQMRDAYVYGERTIASTRSIDSMHNFKDTLLIKVGLQYDYLVNNAILQDDMRHTEEIAESCYQFAKSCTNMAKSLLEKFSKNYKLGLVSNFYGNLEEVLRDFQIRDYFDKVIESAVVGYSKPDKRLWTLALKELDTKPEDATVIGDSYKKDIMPCKQLGCSTIWLKGEGWKENPTNTPFADAIITDIKQLDRYL